VGGPQATCQLNLLADPRADHPQRRIPVDELSAVYVKRNSPASLIKYSNQPNCNQITNSPARKRARHQVSTVSSNTVALPPHICPGSPILIDFRSERSLMEKNHRLTRKKQIKQSQCTSVVGQPLATTADSILVGQAVSIDVLPDDVLLAIFDFCVDEVQRTNRGIEAWQLLVHVCRRWRSVVFGSPRRLSLRLVCTAQTPARATQDVWPPLPILIQGDVLNPSRADNIIAVLEKRSDDVCRIDLDVRGPQWKNISAKMRGPFPELTDLQLLTRFTHKQSESMAAVPDSFLGGSAPCLQKLYFHAIPFPGLPKLLLSAPHLVDLHLSSIPRSGYLSPEAMVTALSTSTSLRSLWLQFQSPRSFPDWESRPLPPSSTPTVFSVLIELRFKGFSDYLDDPQLNKLYITLFNDIEFDAPQFTQFIDRTPRFKALEKACVTFDGRATSINISSETSGYGEPPGELNVNIPCRELDWQVSSLEEVCTSWVPLLPALEALYISEYSRPNWKNNIENTPWLGLLHPFTAVKNLYLSEKTARRIVPALQELVGTRTTEVLPTLRNIFLEELKPSGAVQKGIRRFVAARQVISHPIAISRWERQRE
jgi:hypothetical protein